MFQECQKSKLCIVYDSAVKFGIGQIILPPDILRAQILHVAVNCGKLTFVCLFEGRGS